MSNYQRLIAYIYTYEGGIKGKNIGFAKLETRNIQCKITVNVKKIFVGGNPMGVYLLSNQGELRIGTLFARNGAGEFRTTVNAANVEDSGRGVEEFYGLSVHDVESAWRAYTTIWEDAVAHSAEVELADVTSENLLKKQITEKVEVLPISKEIEKELALEEERKQEEVRKEVQKEVESKMQKEVENKMQQEVENRMQKEVENKKQKEVGNKAQKEVQEEEKRYKEESTMNRGSWRREGAGVRESLMKSYGAVTAAAELSSPVRETGRMEWIANTDLSKSSGSSQSKSMQQEASQPPISQQAPQQAPPNPALPQSFQQGDTQSWTENQVPEAEPQQPDIEADISHPADFIPAPREERETRTHQETWELLRKKFTKILAFDYEDGCEILTIKPQDIGLLPRENWVYGNNSFLLHGYYNYRYLILARLENPNGTPRYLLGVPGNYFSNEKYMAAMFTFPDFVLSKKQPSEDSRFGYWYADIKIGD